MTKREGGKLKLPMKFEEALSDLLKVKPPSKPAQMAKRKRSLRKKR